MGILLLGIGVGGGAVFGSMLHLVNNALAKGVLFLSATNIQRAYGSKRTGDVRGALRRLPISGALLLAGFFAITASPPFGPFFSEFAIVQAAITGGQHVVAALFLGLLVVIFMGMGASIMNMVQGAPSDAATATDYRDDFSSAAPGVILLGLVFLLGVYIPPSVDAALHAAAASVEVRP
jgi:hydrogenase-4 component F